MSSKIAQVILFTNGMVMVSDERGEQMPEYQGAFGEVVNRILGDFSGEWTLAQWGVDLKRGEPYHLLARFRPSPIWWQ